VGMLFVDVETRVSRICLVMLEQDISQKNTYNAAFKT
jgi:hypothetical protein